jgi:hypothetical protein
VGCGAFDVLSDSAGYVLCLLFVHVLRCPGGNADDEAVGWVLPPFGDEGACGDDGALSYPCTVEDGGSHAYEAATFYHAPVHDRVVADYTVLADYGG